ncbi:MAG: YceI family protein [Alphaproteobacteria bacterium]|nr:YceI family protein [Alphaproteobacteria bacterium]
MEAKPATLPVSGVLDVITVKNGDAEVPGRLTGLSGELKLPKADSWAQLDGSFTVDLSTWDTGLELRDTRIKETFFQVAEHPSVSFDVSKVEGGGDMKVGGPAQDMTLHGKLSLYGASKDVSLPIAVTRTSEGGYAVVSKEPLVLDVNDFGMAEPLEALRVLCAHDSLSNTVKVSLRLAFGDAKVPGTEPAEGPPEGEGEADKPAPVKPH